MNGFWAKCRAVRNSDEKASIPLPAYPHSDLHQRAWAYLQTCPAGQKNDYIAWAIIRLESQKEFENILREILKEPEAAPRESVRAHRSAASSTIPGEMLGFLDGLMDME